ncbi:hypothetical protein SAMN05660909_00955 [Chitinophaga terrae (ex Kim and Jung 2007)]|uniref:Patatin-like phospholipase n=1 Tax=Chitinophaga terrae (ex Kim and Jung 2007) TaxID=408074 RepID=A0A1H3YUS6_9BACT|nr:hypothetical protein [Chitinophaga terrae (ex Kim and Jung 2007)]GEP88495.1 hypothetical protein CTE07_01400 [Chitinophaga terrae (ex Kim and Jung 2007)]SEA14838.1 hypothetical protein SAMN05660909_00955 [Chitinophaga terrae (ex Kim and Jung 2007)]
MSRFLSYVNDTWRVLYPVLFSIALLLLGYFCFVNNDQGRDFSTAVIEDRYSFNYFIRSAIALIIWSLSLWYTARILLRLKMIDYSNFGYTRFLIKWLPRVFGVIPVLIFIVALFSVRSTVPTYNIVYFCIYVISYAALGVSIMLFLVYRSRLARKMNIEMMPDSERFNPSQSSLKGVMSAGVTGIVIYIVLLVNLLLFTIFLLPVSAGIASYLHPATIVLLGLSFYTIVFAVIIANFNLRKSPLGVLVLIYIISISHCNDNSVLRTIDDRPLPARETVKSNIKNWLAARLPIHPDTASSRKKIYPIVLIAAEGGGIRAMDWTAMVLQHLNNLHPELYKHVYAISSVSGGGVGSVFFQAYYRDRNSQYIHQPTPVCDSLFRKAIGSDFLSDVTGAFIFQDNLQRIIPFAIPYFNRNRKLEDSWSYGYSHYLQANTFEEPFLSLWQKDTTLKYFIPNMLINGVLAESGQKAITTNLDIKSDSSGLFDDEIDVIKTLGRDVPLKTAASLCSRFPMITSGGLLKRGDSTAIGHIVDGGYKENTGIETMWQLMALMRPYIEQMEDSFKVRLPLYLVYIQNSPVTHPNSEASLKAVTTLPDITTILTGFMNAWDRRTPTFTGLSNKVFNESKLNESYRFYSISLNRDEVQLPLGWYLSKTAHNYIWQEAGRIQVPPLILKQFE